MRNFNIIPFHPHLERVRMSQKEAAEVLFDRDIETWFAASEVMFVIRNGLRSDVWRDGLMRAHFQMVYHFAHYENQRIDRHGWAKKLASDGMATSVAALIISKSEARA